jgi:hypothetical protein
MAVANAMDRHVRDEKGCFSVFEDRGARLKGIGTFQIKLAKAIGGRLSAASCADKMIE